MKSAALPTAMLLGLAVAGCAQFGPQEAANNVDRIVPAENGAEQGLLGFGVDWR